MIAPAQEPDGYLNTVFGRPGQPPRYSDLEWGHELYNDGHLLQAAVARPRTAGRDEFVEIARRVADHVCDTFADGGIERVCGHPEIELGLVELARADRRAALPRPGGDVRRAARARARSARSRSARRTSRTTSRSATPPCSAATPCGRCTSPPAPSTSPSRRATTSCSASLIAQWEATLARRTYLTGGMGSQHTGEAFGDDFVLPPDRAYSETCAGIGSVMLAWRLLLATGEPRFADLIERTLYNVVATSPAPDGRHFFYANPLHQRVPGTVPQRRRGEPAGVVEPARAVVPRGVLPDQRGAHARQPRRLPRHRRRRRRAGAPVRRRPHRHDARRRPPASALEVATDYPQTGTVTVRVTEARRATRGRSPCACRRGPTARRVDRSERRAPVAPPGTVVVERPFAPGDEVTLTLPMTPRWTRPDPRIDAVRGCVAVERGPLVMCAESVDLPGQASVDLVRVDTTQPIVDQGESVTVAAVLADPPADGWPYRSPGPQDGDDAPAERPIALSLIPYHRWATRGPTTMRVWLPEDGR